jgi:hypothetical protein
MFDLRHVYEVVATLMIMMCRSGSRLSKVYNQAIVVGRVGSQNSWPVVLIWINVRPAVCDRVSSILRDGAITPTSHPDASHKADRTRFASPSSPPLLFTTMYSSAINSRLEWSAQLNPSKAPKTTEETRHHRKVSQRSFLRSKIYTLNAS